MPENRTIEKRLDAARQRFENDSFLHNRGLSNEAALHIFQYSPKDEMIVRSFVSDIVKEFDGKEKPCRVIHFDLYDILLDICRERRILDRIPEMEEKRGSEFIRDQVKNVAKPETYIRHMQYGEHHPGDVLVLTGVGRVYPYMRSHNILNNIQHVFEDIPVVMFYPGSYDGQSLRLFDLFMDDHYYRAFNLIGE